LSPVTSSTVGPAGATPTTLAAESSLRVVVVNAGGPPGIAARTAVDLRSGGYASVVTTDAVRAQTSSLVAFAPGFEAEARRLAAALEMSPGQVTPRATAQMPANDGPADLVVLLGTDRG